MVTPLPPLALQAPVEIFGVRLVGISSDVGKKLLFSLILIAGVLLVSTAVRWLFGSAVRRGKHERARFWGRQITAIVAAVVIIIGLISIWFENPTRVAGALGLVAAGIAVALQKVITSVAAYLIILRGEVFRVGDRITMGGVRGDVIRLGLTRTTVMEMGEPPVMQSAPPDVWITARQYTGRVVNITNDKIFDSPVYNYTREFPYLWEELRLPVKYEDDRHRAEQILLEAARRHTAPIMRQAEAARHRLLERYFVAGDTDLEPRVFYRLTDNWLELTLRFVAEERGVRALKNDMSREILEALDAAGIGIASSTYDIVGFPPIRLQEDARNASKTDGK